MDQSPDRGEPWLPATVAGVRWARMAVASIGFFRATQPPQQQRHTPSRRPRAAHCRAVWSAHHINTQFSNKRSTAASELTRLKKILCMLLAEGDQTLRARRPTTI
jgi:hypothetical protein